MCTYYYLSFYVLILNFSNYLFTHTLKTSFPQIKPTDKEKKLLLYMVKMNTTEIFVCLVHPVSGTVPSR